MNRETRSNVNPRPTIPRPEAPPPIPCIHGWKSLLIYATDNPDLMRKVMSHAMKKHKKKD